MRLAQAVPIASPTKAGAAAPQARGDGVRTLTRAVARGDDQAFADFYHEWFEPAYAMARSLTRRDESFCLDIVQDAMLKAARSMRPLDSRAQLESWVRRVVHTAALDRLRADRRRVARERNAHPPSESDPRPDTLPLLDEHIAWLREQISELPPEERSLLRFRFAQSSTLEEAGAAHGLTADAAHGRLRRTIDRLKHAARGRTP